MEYQVDKTTAGDQWTFAGAQAMPRSWLYSIGTIMETKISGRYPEKLKPKDFIEASPLRRVRRNWCPRKE